MQTIKQCILIILTHPPLLTSHGWSRSWSTRATLIFPGSPFIAKLISDKAEKAKVSSS